MENYVNHLQDSTEWLLTCLEEGDVEGAKPFANDIYIRLQNAPIKLQNA